MVKNQIQKIQHFRAFMLMGRNHSVKEYRQAVGELAGMHENWERELNNFLDYVDGHMVDQQKKDALFYRGIDSIEAGEILIGSKYAVKKFDEITKSSIFE